METLQKNTLVNLSNFPGAIAIYRYGSSTFDFLKNAHDIDYIVIYRTEKEIEDQYLAEMNFREKNPDLDFFCVALETFETGKYLELHTIKFASKEEYKWSYRFFRTSIAPIPLILIHWAKWYAGEQIDFEKYTKLTIQFKELLLLGVKLTEMKIKNVVDEDLKPLKNWYYLFIAYFVYLNDSFSFSEDQIKIIQKAHDRQLTLDECHNYTIELNYCS